MGGVEPAWDDLAEQAMLGLVLLAPDRAETAFLTLSPDDWYRPAHSELAAVISTMLKSGQSVDPVTVFGQVQAQGLTRHWDAAKIFGLTQIAFRPESASALASRLRELSGRRKLVSALSVEAGRLQSLSDDDGAAEVRAATARIRAACDVADETAADRETPLPRGMGEFLEAQSAARQWLVPGLLERMDRTVITGAEGGGKSVLASQLSACMAAGVHPFGAQVLGDGTHGVRVLVIDCENSDDQSRRRYKWVIDRVNKVRHNAGFDSVNWNEQMCIDTKPAGIDLLSGRDISWLEHSIQAVAPDLLVLGPLYKLHHRDPSEETSAREVAWVIDNLRERYGFALLTEAHAGNGTDMAGNRVMRPIGSSLWRRWPEFGFGLRRAKEDPRKARAEIVDVVAWRGAREERAWPQKLQMGDRLPWLPDAEYLATMDDYH